MSPHIRLAEVDDRAVITIDDWEVLDYIDDYLCEECDLEYDYLTESETDGRRYFSMHFTVGTPIERLSSALDRLPDEEVERIWRLNNQ